MLTNETPQASANCDFDWATSELVWNDNQLSNQTISEFMVDYWINNQKYKIAPQQKTTTFWPPSSPDSSPEWPVATTSRAEPETESEETTSQEETSEYESDDNDDMATITPKEIWINTPKTFNGDRNNLNKFIQSCSVYLDLNAKIFNSNKKKILFILSYMTEGTAEAWK